jgi:two-component system chemotaxis sensor kinase CheA
VGKPRQGTISITCEKKQSRMVITVRDNGRGLDADAIRQKAKDLPAFATIDVSSLSDAQAMALIFKTGFSTAKVAALDAGRGVGLALVKTRIEENGGQLKVRTGKGKYTEFEISVPT